MQFDSPAVRLLRRRFLQGLLYNDLLSPDADRRQSLATATAALVTAGLFASSLLSLRYLMTPFLSAGRAAVGMLDDTLLFVGWSIIVGAVVAVAQWNAIALDGRDAAVLGTLPVRPADIVRAKLGALVLFASGLGFALNAAPSVIYPVLVMTALGGGTAAVLQLVFAHALSTMAAAWFGFASVVALREVTRAVAGRVLFGRIGTAMQSGLLVLCVVAFLLLPGGSSRIARTWLEGGQSWRSAVPALWFVGLHDTLTGDAVIGVPVGALPRSPARSEREAMSLYRSRIPTLRRLAGVAALAFGIAVVSALTAFLWNSRRLSTPVQRLRRTRVALMSRCVVRRTVARRQGVRAGFFFTLQCISRNAPHRAAIGVAAAVGLAVTLVNIRIGRSPELSTVPLAFLGSQIAVLTALSVGFAHAIRLPADVRGNWVFQLAWSGDERPYIAGVKRAALLSLAAPALLGLLPLHVIVLGWRVALWHTLNGLLVACALLDVLMLNARKLPLASSFTPSENLTWAAPVGFFAFLLMTYLFVLLERAALADTTDSAIFAAGLVALLAVFRLLAWYRHWSGVAIDLSDVPPPGTQSLKLTD